jgi:hypothetical protein
VHSVLVAVPAVGAGLQLEDVLRRAGANARWDASYAQGPRRDAISDEVAVVVLDADHLSDRLAAVVAAWRSAPALPGVIAIGDGETARASAPSARVTLLAGKASATTLLAAVREAYRLRLTMDLSWPVLTAALGVSTGARVAAAVADAVVAARGVSLELPRVALGWYSHHYVTATALLPALIEERRLTVPERDAVAAFDGTCTLRGALQRGPLDVAQAARLTWALACTGAIELTVEPRDVATAARRALTELRRHLTQRKLRLAGRTFYDVLEVTPLAEAPQIEEAYRLQAQRFAPAALASFDLGELRASVEPLWQLVEKARATLCDLPARGRYHDWLRGRGELSTVWAIEPQLAQQAAAAFAHGQQALGDGDVHRAVGELAAACRAQPGHPEYEAALAWARFRVKAEAGHPAEALARQERAALQELLTGIRAWPRALLALAMLCAADGDVAAARWHVEQALEVEPGLPGALQLRRRLLTR